VIRGSDVVDPCQAHFLHQAVLQRFEQSLDPPFGVSRGLRRNVSVKNDDFALLIPIIRGADRNLN
jgi:hypothetical protein